MLQNTEGFPEICTRKDIATNTNTEALAETGSGC